MLITHALKYVQIAIFIPQCLFAGTIRLRRAPDVRTPGLFLLGPYHNFPQLCYMKCLELFAGTCSFGKVATSRGHETTSLDNQDLPGIDLVMNFLDFNPKDLGFIPQILWASPPCNGFSVARQWQHWHKNKQKHYIPVTDTSRMSVALARATIRTVKYFSKLNPDLLVYIENPRGLLRKMPFMQNLPRRSITYCQYGESVQKPTDIWTNNIYWMPKPMCEPGERCHEASPSGYTGGIQARLNARARGVIPPQLIEEILISTEKVYGKTPLKA